MTPTNGPERSLAIARTRLIALSARLERLPFPTFAAVSLLLGVVKIGLSGVGPNFLNPLRVAASAFPEITSSFSSSVGPLLLMRGLAIPGDGAWWLVGSALLLALLASLAAAASRLGPWARPAVLTLAASPVLHLSASMIGHYDMWLIAGGLLLVLSNSRTLGAMGILIACLGNPQQALVAAVALLATAMLLPERTRARRAAVFLGAAMSVWAATEWWAAAAGHVSRTGLLDLAGALFGLRLFAGSWPLTLYSFLGPIWLLLIVGLVAAPAGLRRAALPAVLIPLAATLVTLDMTRVFVSTSSAALTLYFTSYWNRHWRADDPPRWLLGALSLAALILPAVVVLPEPDAFVRLPYDQALDFLGWHPDWSARR